MREWLKAIRKKKGASQKSVAKAVGIAQASYCLFEHGKRRPSPEIAKKIASFLNFDWTRFYDDTDKTENPLTYGGCV